MKTFLTTAAVVAALTMPAFAEGDDASTKAGEASGNVKASTQEDATGASAMGQRRVLPRADTTGAGSASTAKGTSLESEKSTTGADTGDAGSDRGGGSSGSSGSGSR